MLFLREYNKQIGFNGLSGKDESLWLRNGFSLYEWKLFQKFSRLSIIHIQFLKLNVVKYNPHSLSLKLLNI